MSASRTPIPDITKEYSDQMSAPSQEETLVGLICDIGKEYIRKHPPGLLNITKNLFNTNQHTAEKMATYKPADISKKRAHESFLINRYLELPNYTGNLAGKIRALYKDYFYQDISPALLIKKISAGTLQEIGNDYLIKHPKPTNGWFSLYKKHNNQDAASLLRDCLYKNSYTKEYAVASHPRDLWNALLDVYKLLPNDSGELATKIEHMITNVFGIRFKKVDTMGGQVRNLTNPEIAEKARYRVAEKVEAAYKHLESQAEEMEVKNSNSNKPA